MYTVLMRNNTWLAEQLRQLHLTHFSDVSIPNTIHVRFGRASIRRLGSILAKQQDNKLVTTITVTKLFQSDLVPELVVQATLAHEFAHYTHGFHSPHPKRYKHPHRGKVIEKELLARGLSHLLVAQNLWLKHSYQDFLRDHRTR
jgi:hypothetical protein